MDDYAPEAPMLKHPIQGAKQRLGNMGKGLHQGIGILGGGMVGGMKSEKTKNDLYADSFNSK